MHPFGEEKYEEYMEWMRKEEEKIGIEKGMEMGLEKDKEIGKGEGILIGKEETKREAALRMLDVRRPPGGGSAAHPRRAELICRPERFVLWFHHGSLVAGSSG